MRASLFLLLAACTEHGETPAGSVSLSVSGTLTQAETAGGIVPGVIGDNFTGTIIYFDDAVDTGEGSSDSAFYRFRAPPVGMSIKVAGITYQTDPANVDLLINVVDRPGSDGIVFRSMTNQCSAGCAQVDMLAWQLDDFSGSAVTSLDLPASIDVARFTQDFGLTLVGTSADLSEMWLLRGTVNDVSIGL